MVYCKAHEAPLVVCVEECSRVTNVCDEAVVSKDQSGACAGSCLNDGLLALGDMHEVRLTVFETL